MSELHAKVITQGNPFLVDYLTLYTDENVGGVEVMPTPESKYLNKIIQHTGPTKESYINGYFYKCIEESGTYRWVQTDTQPYTLGKFLSVWDCTTGLPETDPNPASSPYNYTTGDYYVVGKVSTTSTNYKPSGTSYTRGTTSTSVESGTVGINDIYKYDGTGNWIKVSDDSKKITWGNITGTLSNQTDLSQAINERYLKPTNGIPASDLEDAVKAGLVKAATYGTTSYAQIRQWMEAGNVVTLELTEGGLTKKFTAIAYTNDTIMFCSVYSNIYYYAQVTSSDNWWRTSYTFEQMSNKVTSISSSSTDTQYPSAKAVYDAIKENSAKIQYGKENISINATTRFAGPIHISFTTPFTSTPNVVIQIQKGGQVFDNEAQFMDYSKLNIGVTNITVNGFDIYYGTTSNMTSGCTPVVNWIAMI